MKNYKSYYAAVFATCCVVIIVFSVLSLCSYEKFDPDVSYNGVSITSVDDWKFSSRLEDYKENIESLKSAVLNLIIMSVLGILLLFYSPEGIEVSFIKLTIPESLLFLFVIFGTMYSWAQFGLEFNSAIDSRWVLKIQLEHLYPISVDTEMTQDHPIHLLVDNGLLDNWFSVWHNEFDASISKQAGFSYNIFEWIGLLFIYGVLFGLVFAVGLVAPIEFGKRIKEFSTLSKLFLLLILGMLISSTYNWAFDLHKFSCYYVVWVWCVCVFFILFWIIKSDDMIKKIKEMKSAANK